MTEKNPPYVITARADHAADSFRLMMAGLSGRTEGVFGPNDLTVTQDTGSNMNSRVGAGGAFMYGDSNIVQGVYSGYNDASVALTHAAAPGTSGQTRYDLVCARVQDAAYAGGTNAWDLRVNQGTASTSPVDPALAVNEIALARVTVAFGQLAITNANITDLRPRVFATGGIGVVNSARRPGTLYGPMSFNALGGPGQPGPSEGIFIYEWDADRLLHHDGTTWVPIGNVRVCTSGTHPAPWEGQIVYETDTDAIQYYDGANWKRSAHDIPHTLDFWSPNAVTKTSNTAYTNMVAGSTVQIANFPKYRSDTKLLIEVHANKLDVGTIGGGNSNYYIGALVNGVDYDICVALGVDTGFYAFPMSGVRSVTGLAAGTYTIVLRHKRDTANSWAPVSPIMFTVTETL